MKINLDDLTNAEDRTKLLIAEDHLYAPEGGTALERDYIVSAKVWVDRKDNNSSP